MRSDLPGFQDLYSEPGARDLAYQSALVEASGYGRWSRLREIAEFARRMRYERLGIARCSDMAWEAELAARYLMDHRFTVRLPDTGTDGDPRGQALSLANQGVSLSIIAGMSVGHEALFTFSSSVPVTSLVARDVKFAHNPAAALYTSESYSHADLYGARPSLEPAPFRGWDPSILAEAAVELPHEDTGPWCRIRETIEYARRLGTTHMGVSFCVGLRREAAILTRVLEANGFRVTSVCCKVGAIPKGTLGVTEQEKIRPHAVEIMCNPLAQAELLNRKRAELVLILGQCVGHDSATIARLEAPAVYLVAKDRSLGHNTVAALYQLEERRSPLVNPVTHPREAKARQTPIPPRD